MVPSQIIQPSCLGREATAALGEFTLVEKTMEMRAVLANGSFHAHNVRALCCLLTLMSKHFALSPAFIDEMVEGNEWIKSMVDGIEREKKKRQEREYQGRY